MKTSLPIVACLCLFAGGVAAEDEGDPLAQFTDEELRAEVLAGISSNVGIFTEYIAIDHLLLAGLLREHEQQLDAEWLRGELAKLEKKGEAKVVESSYVITRSGQRAKIEAIREWIYPTEWDPPEVPQELTGPVDRDALIKTPNTPTAFEMRPVGMTLEVDPVVGSDGVTVALNFAPELVEFCGNRENGKAEAINLLPEFYTQKFVSSINCVDGRAEMFGITSPSRSPSDKRVVGFVTANLLKAISRRDLQRLHRSPRKYVQEKYGDLAAQSVPVTDDPFAVAAEETEPREKPKTSPHLSVLAELIEVDVAQAHRIIAATGQSSDATQARHRLDKLIASGQAKLLETAYGLGGSGQRFKVESVGEWIYPTEMDPPEVPQDLTGPIGPGVDLVTPVSSTAFEMRAIGLTLEVDAVLGSDGETIEFNIAPELVRLAGELDYGRDAALAVQPLFESFSVRSCATVSSGTALLFGMGGFETARAQKAATEAEQAAVEGRRLLLFITPTARPAR